MNLLSIVGKPKPSSPSTPAGSSSQRPGGPGGPGGPGNQNQGGCKTVVCNFLSSIKNVFSDFTANKDNDG
jgi:hypothetical protein